MENKGLSKQTIKDLLQIEDSQPVQEEGKVIWVLPNGRLHRKYGPAIIHEAGYQFWYKNGLKHRLDGPASIFPNGVVEYWVDGTCYTYEEFKTYLSNPNQDSWCK